MACRGICDKFPKKRTEKNAYCRTCQKFSLKNSLSRCYCCNMKYRDKPRKQKKKERKVAKRKKKEKF